jgi:hypothetical protein
MWSRCGSIRKSGNLFRRSYNFCCYLNSQSCWFVCSVKPWHVCLGFHRGEKGFGHACVWLLSRRIIRNRNECSCLRVWNSPFSFYWRKLFSLMTVFIRDHMGFARISTLVIIFTSVTIMALLRTLETNECSFALAFSLSKCLTFGTTYRARNIWVYPDVIMANANRDWNIESIKCY